MTTIAWDGRTLAADRRGCCGSCSFPLTKIRRAADGRLIGVAGPSDIAAALLDWIEQGHGERPRAQAEAHDIATAIEIEPGGACWRHERFGRFRVEGEFHACGSGRDFAIAAMALGLDAVGAVALAARFDPGTGDGIDTLALGAA